MSVKGAYTGVTPATEIGEHGREILAALGFDAAAVARLAAEGIVRLPQVP
jgi:crotonobetainyl-CoA:carnitine CoA-transferase CaiB-like acyl-CoA transferase